MVIEDHTCPPDEQFWVDTSPRWVGEAVGEAEQADLGGSSGGGGGGGGGGVCVCAGAGGDCIFPQRGMLFKAWGLVNCGWGKGMVASGGAAK